jgi:hypothetical protein
MTNSTSHSAGQEPHKQSEIPTAIVEFSILEEEFAVHKQECDQLARRITDEGSDFEPGLHWIYSDEIPYNIERCDILVSDSEGSDPATSERGGLSDSDSQSGRTPKFLPRGANPI